MHALLRRSLEHADGPCGRRVTTCCLDEHLENRLGNLRERGLASIWNGKTVNAWRLAHVEGR